MKKGKLTGIILLSIIIASVFTMSVSAENGARYELPFDINAQSYLVVSLDTGEIIYEKNSRDAYIPASLTKLFTAYTVLNYTDDLDNSMVTAPSYIYDELYGLNSSTADIRQREVLSVRQLLYALLLPSANEAASILADYVGNGNMSNFFMMMNNDAKKLGCINSHFTNAHGLFFDNHYTCCYDLYLVAKALYEKDGFMDIVTTNSYQMPANVKHSEPYYIFSTVKMQNKSSPYYRSYCNGMKTGSLPEIGHNFVSVCKQNGETYICVVIGCNRDSDPSAAFTTTATIMDYMFANFSLKQANSSVTAVTEVRMKYSSDADTLLLYADTPVYSVLPNTADETTFRKVYHLPDAVKAPVKYGDVIGSVDYYLSGEMIGSSNLVSHNDYSRNFLMFITGIIGDAFSSLYFRVVIIVALSLAAVYVIGVISKKRKNDRIKKVHRK